MDDRVIIATKVYAFNINYHKEDAMIVITYYKDKEATMPVSPSIAIPAQFFEKYVDELGQSLKRIRNQNK